MASLQENVLDAKISPELRAYIQGEIDHRANNYKKVAMAIVAFFGLTGIGGWITAYNTIKAEAVRSATEATKNSILDKNFLSRLSDNERELRHVERSVAVLEDDMEETEETVKKIDSLGKTLLNGVKVDNLTSIIRALADAKDSQSLLAELGQLRPRIQAVEQSLEKAMSTERTYRIISANTVGKWYMGVANNKFAQGTAIDIYDEKFSNSSQKWQFVLE